MQQSIGQHIISDCNLDQHSWYTHNIELNRFVGDIYDSLCCDLGYINNVHCFVQANVTSKRFCKI